MNTRDPAFIAQLEQAVEGVRRMMAYFRVSLEEAVATAPVPNDLRPYILAEIQRQEAVVKSGNEIALVQPHQEWLLDTVRDDWYYWPRLRSYLIDKRNWPEPTVRSLDRVTDKILGAMENPRGEADFDSRGLVVGYVQSGKTANYSALIAKAADAGYRLIIVLSGIHNSLRLQTQRRLDAELVGRVNGKPGGVGRPTPRKDWITFTKALAEGDFNPGTTSTATLSMEKPSLMVIKKNAMVLERLIGWLDDLPQEVRATLPCLVIDDEADQASINTGGNRPPEDLDQADVNPAESPTTINLRIRDLLNRFQRVAYVAYTATPYANVLIDHTAVDQEGRRDLYPASFIISLPRPHGYYGAERIFGSPDGSKRGMDVVLTVPDDEIPLLIPARRSDIPDFDPEITPMLRQALDDFMLAGAARIQRGDLTKPATMLIHTSYSTTVQKRLYHLVNSYTEQFRDDWEYSKLKKRAIQQRLQERWDSEFRRVTRAEDPARDVPFASIEPHIHTFLKRLQVLEINNISEHQLDYERDPDLKVIVVGGNRLSRGLTLEGLLVSFYVRPSRTYDTLMQMGRWFGFRDGYADLTRIYTTLTLRDWFRDLAGIEEELRDEIARYEQEGLTPMAMGAKIRQHPAMMITSPLKMGSGARIQVSFAGQVAQTITFPLRDHRWLRRNIAATQEFLANLGRPDNRGNGRPVWCSVAAVRVLEFLAQYQMDPAATRIQSDPISRYIRAQNAQGELTEWVVGVMGLKRPNAVLGTLDLNIAGGTAINLMERTRLKNKESLGVIVSPEDESLGLTDAQVAEAEAMLKTAGEKLSRARAFRARRNPRQGLLLIYPISANSGHHRCVEDRQPLHPVRDSGEHVIGIALSFPDSETAATVEYVVGSVGAGES